MINMSLTFMQEFQYTLEVYFSFRKYFFSIFDNEPESADFCNPVSQSNSDPLCLSLHNLLSKLSWEVPVAQVLKQILSFRTMMYCIKFRYSYDKL